MGHHHLRSLWENSASTPHPPGSASSNEERAAIRGKRIIEFGLLALNLLLMEFMPSPLSTPTLSVTNSIRYPVVAVKPHDTHPPTAMAREILEAHNRYRAEFGVPPLHWSVALEAHALAWANLLTAEKAFQHAHNPYHEGENLWMGTAGYFSYTTMIDAFGSEKQYYIPGVFPDVSKTGDWKDVGHYTQMVWPTTTHVGCAGVSGADGYYRLVCRYSPAGNVFGERVK